MSSQRRRRNCPCRRTSRATWTSFNTDKNWACCCWMWLLWASLLLVLGQCHVAFAEQLQAPRFLQQPSASGSIVNEGQTKILQCQAAGVPLPRYRWMKDDVFLGNFTSEPFYRMKSAKKSDAGRYRCIAQNVVGSILSEEAKVVVAYLLPLNDERTNQTVTAQTSEAVILRLPPIESEPAPTVTWVDEDDKPLYETKYSVTLDNRLVILDVEDTDSKMFKARITNTQVGKEEETGYYVLEVSGNEPSNEQVPPDIIVAPEDVQVVKGVTAAELQCIANARPVHLIQIFWQKDGVPIAHAKVSYTFNDLWNRTLTLTNIDSSHNGVYKCEVHLQNHNFRPVSAAANVTVLEKPRLEDPPGPVFVKEHRKSVSFVCQAGGKPSPEVKWFHNSVLLNTSINDRITITSKHMLSINDLQPEDEGIYQCTASNIAGETSAYWWLQLKSSPVPRAAVMPSENDLLLNETEITPTAPSIIDPPINHTVHDGKDAKLTCGSKGSPPPNTTWVQNDSVVIRSEGRIQILDNGALLIAAAQPSDTGKYTCIKTNTVGTVDSSGYLTVLVKTQIIQPPVDTKVILGHRANLACRVSHDELVPYTVQWYYEKRLLKPMKDDRIKIKGDGSLEIQEARNIDIGTYMCVVTSPGGNDSRTAKIDVIELPYSPTAVKAELLKNVPKAVNVSWIPGFDGKSSVRNFIIQKRTMRNEDPTPDPMVDWVTALTNVSREQRWIVLTNLKPAMNYQFRVSAVNGVGEGNPSEPSNRVTLPQEAPSAPPNSVVGSPRSPTSIMIQWHPPTEEDRNGELRGYVIKYHIYGYPEDWKNRTIANEAQRSYIIDNLITWQLYEIKVGSFNDKGIGVYSESIRVRTKEGVPLEAPAEVRVEALSSTSIQVWWIPPNPQMINGVNQGYKIQLWKSEPNEKVKPYSTVVVQPSLTDPIAEQTEIVTNLEKYEEYNVTILCFTNPGDGRRTEPVIVKTLQDVPDAVASLTCEDVKDTTVQLLWSPPTRNNGILLAYTLRYYMLESPDNVIVKNLSVSMQEILLTELTPSTEYVFEIFAWTEIGRGPSKTIGIQSGVPPVLPHAPTKLSVSKVEAFSALLQFTPGFNGNTSITKYSVEAQIGRNDSWVVIYESPPPDTPAITVENLIPYMEYKLRIIANNVVGSSPPSDPSRSFQSLQAPPSHPPRSVTVRALNATALRVRWTPLQQLEWCGIPRGYNISYRIHGTNDRRRSLFLENHNANSFIIESLDEYTEYEVMVEAYNDVGSSRPSSVAIERTKESVPGSGPLNVIANATSSTTVVVSWDEVPDDQKNGILEGYKVHYGAKNMPSRFKDIPNNSTFTTTLTELKKYVQYSIQVLAYTRMGDGKLSEPPILERTFEDVPGPPSNVSFPDVSQTMARMIWDIPEEPNGVILEYKVTASLEGGEIFVDDSLAPTTRTWRATDLDTEKDYIFTIVARTNVGWGKMAKAKVFTTSNREPPQAPSAPLISPSQIQSDQITFSWTPGRDGFAPLRYYTIQQADESGNWQLIPEKVDPSLMAYTVKNLKPFTKYKFRIQASNDIGASKWSPESNYTRTLAGTPSLAPEETNVLAITTTDVKITWKPLPPEAWGGDMSSGGYRIEYHPVSEFVSGRSPSEEIHNPTASEITLNNLARDKIYEFVLSAFNSQGEGPKTRPQTTYVGEAVPTGQPQDFEAMAISPTEIKLTWKPPPENQQNGELQGYKIFIVKSDKPKASEEMEVISASTSSYTLIDLHMYTLYHVELLAFNPAGDGPRSAVIEVRTKEGVPSQPTNLAFSEITMNSLNVSWSVPEFPNGRIVGYHITYETLPTENFSKQVRQRVNTTSLEVYNLEEEATYTFRVCAETIHPGPEVIGNVTTGPQIGSPEPPFHLTLNPTVSAVILEWENGQSLSGPIIGYIVESKKEEDAKWQRVLKVIHGPMTEWAISFQNLVPSKKYNFRLFAVNGRGISPPAVSQDLVVVPSKMVQELGLMKKTPFYREVWFLVALAATSVIIIILVVSVLCIKSKSYKYKHETVVKPASEDKPATDDGGFATFELRQSRRGGTLRKNTLGRKNGKLSNGNLIAKAPPRPSPASVTYSDEEDLKGYDDNCDSSSLTEKPSEISSTETEATESEPESEKSNPHSFVNHYANVNDTFRQSWKRQRPTKAYSSYTDSEPEGSVAVSLNGGHILMNNMAGSRAPLPGFSSFV